METDQCAYVRRLFRRDSIGTSAAGMSTIRPPLPQGVLWRLWLMARLSRMGKSEYACASWLLVARSPDRLDTSKRAVNSLNIDSIYMEHA